ncbi:MAG: hypothetical protein F9K24_13090 [Leptonema illini]|uniref:Uncharacterized protein n=1 Tax=Leptonema illini TaxID=183 RepID=A0A833H0B7_9LEPT|nr:MAG: hypothetical protein F9K24_13090 [Leptonema illini]
MKRFLPSLILTVPFFIGCPGGESSDDSAAALLLLSAAGGGCSTASETCAYTAAGGPSGSTTLNAPMIALSGSGCATMPTVTPSGSGTYWTAYRFPAVKAGTVIKFDFNPGYVHTGTVMGYETSSCPIDSVNAPVTTSFTAFTASYGSTTTITITAAGAGKDVIFIGGPAAANNPSGKTVTRTDP